MIEALRFEGDRGSCVELHLLTDLDGPSGDLYIGATAEVRGFRGAADCYVEAVEWRTFVEQLVALESTRRGEASLSSISPGVLELTVAAIDAAGHMGIRGRLGWDMGPDVTLEFTTFAFDPTTLPELVRIARTWSPG